MKLDLIIPTHNRSGLLKDCLDSILLATVPAGMDITVFVVDNNSTDDTAKVVPCYLQSRIAMKYLFVKRAGKSAALNEALAQTSGDLVGLIDDDEQIESNWFEVAYREFCSDPSLDFIGGPYFPAWEAQPPSWIPDTYNGALGVMTRGSKEAAQLTRQQYAKGKNPMLMGGNAVIRRSALQQALPYPEHLGKIGGKIRSGEDEVIYHRLLSVGAKGMVVPELIVYHWIPAERMTKKYYRKWVVGRGIAQGIQLKDRGFTESSLFGFPRYRFRIGMLGFLKMLVGGSSQNRFTGQLDFLDCVASLFGSKYKGLT